MLLFVLLFTCATSNAILSALLLTDQPSRE